jgi:hypothetical protein
MPINLQVVNVGSSENDGTGDKGRVAFTKVNENSEVIVAALEDAERKAYVVPITANDAVVQIGDFESWRMPYAFVLTEVRASLEIEDSGGDVSIDITEEGYSIFQSGELLVVPAGSDTSVGYSPQPTVEYVLIEDNNRIRIEVEDVPSGGTAAGLKVYLIGYVIWTTF